MGFLEEDMRLQNNNLPSYPIELALMTENLEESFQKT